MKAVIKSSDSSGNTNINRIDYEQDNNNIVMKIDNNGNKKQYEMTVEDVLNMIEHNNQQPADSLKQRIKAITFKPTNWCWIRCIGLFISKFLMGIYTKTSWVSIRSSIIAL